MCEIQVFYKIESHTYNFNYVHSASDHNSGLIKSLFIVSESNPNILKIGITYSRHLLKDGHSPLYSSQGQAAHKIFISIHAHFYDDLK